MADSNPSKPPLRMANARPVKLVSLLLFVLLSSAPALAPCFGGDASMDAESFGVPKGTEPFYQERIREIAAHRQEAYRTRIPIPDAVRDDVPLAAFATPMRIVKRETSSPWGLPGGTCSNLVFTIVFLSVGILAIRKFAPEIVENIHFQAPQWRRAPESRDALERVRAEEAAFTKFLAEFKTGFPPKRTPALAASDSLHSGTPTEDVPENPTLPISEFFDRADGIIGRIRTIPGQINRESDLAGRQRLLATLGTEIASLRNLAAQYAQLVSLQQIACAVEGLVGQMATRAANVTRSTLRTVSGGVDLLQDLCKPGVEMNVLSQPPMRFLAVDDDLISRKAIGFALKKTFHESDIVDGPTSALSLVENQSYDAIFLDVQMPGMDGHELCERIHQTTLNGATPVIFVTSASDFDAQIRSAMSGGSELIGKPFLTFEITVKALTFAARRRLKRLEETSVQTATSIPATPDPVKAPAVEAAREPVETVPDGAYGARLSAASIPSELPENEVIRQFLVRAGQQIAPMRKLIGSALQTTAGVEQLEFVEDLYLHVNSLAVTASMAKAHPACQVGGCLEAVIRKLIEDSRNRTLSALWTMANAIDLLGDLCASEVNPGFATNPPIRILVVDDDPVARRCIGNALQTVFERPECASEGNSALELAAEKHFDVIFLDVQMPGMDGFEVCSRLRQAGRNRETPVVFVTAQDHFKASAQATSSGGSHLIGKPFLVSEICLNAITFALRGRLGRAGNPWLATIKIFQ